MRRQGDCRCLHLRKPTRAVRLLALTGARGREKPKYFGMKALLIRDICDDIQDNFLVMRSLLAVNAPSMLA